MALCPSFQLHAHFFFQSAVIYYWELLSSLPGSSARSRLDKVRTQYDPVDLKRSPWARRVSICVWFGVWSSLLRGLKLGICVNLRIRTKLVWVLVGGLNIFVLLQRLKMSAEARGQQCISSNLCSGQVNFPWRFGPEWEEKERKWLHLEKTWHDILDLTRGCQHSWHVCFIKTFLVLQEKYTKRLWVDQA